MKLLNNIGAVLYRRRLQHQSSPAHIVASQYWANCSNTFLADADYYEKCEVVLCQNVLSRVGFVDRVLDLGCGSGRFTLLLASTGRNVDAFDLSPTLIEQAARSAREQNIRNIRFRVEDITCTKLHRSVYGLVSCMGVLSTIIDDWAFQKVTHMLRATLQPEGWLLLRETLSSVEQGQLVESDGYAIRYRNENAYRNTFRDLGFNLESEIPLISAGTCANRFFLYRVAGGR